jgi:hypothetical protein
MADQNDNNPSWEGVCVIGLGGHAQNKLLPALKSTGLAVTGLVSRNPSATIPGAKNFLTVADALSWLPESTLFVIATPPNIHYTQAKAVIEAGRDVFVEKPAFLSRKEAVELSQLAQKRQVVLVEMLMYLENNSVQRVIEKLKCTPDSLKKIECQFLIPSVPPGTFRNEKTFGNSLLPDMACYPLSLLAIAGYDLPNIALVTDNLQEKESPKFSFKGKYKKTAIHILVGQDDQYINSLTLEFEGGRKIFCEPFFYGRDGHRALTRSTKTEEITEQIPEANAYELMFLRKRSEWLATQKERLDALGLVSESLERLGRQAGLL